MKLTQQTQHWLLGLTGLLLLISVGANVFLYRRLHAAPVVTRGEDSQIVGNQTAFFGKIMEVSKDSIVVSDGVKSLSFAISEGTKIYLPASDQTTPPKLADWRALRVNQTVNIVATVGEGDEWTATTIAVFSQ